MVKRDDGRSFDRRGRYFRSHIFFQRGGEWRRRDSLFFFLRIIYRGWCSSFAECGLTIEFFFFISSYVEYFFHDFFKYENFLNLNFIRLVFKYISNDWFLGIGYWRKRFMEYRLSLDCRNFFPLLNRNFKYELLFVCFWNNFNVDIQQSLS